MGLLFLLFLLLNPALRLKTLLRHKFVGGVGSDPFLLIEVDLQPAVNHLNLELILVHML